MTSARLTELIEAVTHGGCFFATGTQTNGPLLEIEGLGLLPLPVVPALLPHLRAVALPAPHGRGPYTVLDDRIRRCHQLDPAQVVLPGSLGETVAEIVHRACALMGVAGQVTARFYKLLIYGPGDHFVAHRDTEKDDGMFATLVLSLPSTRTGGVLEIAHNGE